MADSKEPVLQYRPRRRRRAPKADPGAMEVSDLVMPTLARLGLKTKALQLQLINRWPSVVGDMVAEHTVVAGFARGRLTIETDSPAMGHALHRQRQDIIDQLNREVGADVVADLHFRLGRQKA